jgi:aromatic-L-amino-acid/L-tryptophan decarboxylase
VDADPRFERTAPTPFSVVCFRYKGTDGQNRAIQEAVNACGEVFISGTVLNGRFTLRLAVGNQATTRRHVQRAWELVKQAVPAVT